MTILCNRPRSGPNGFTLVELMIAMLLGILLVGGIVMLLVSSRKNIREDEHVSKLQDELRFAMAQITADIEMAGFWGVLLDPTGIELAASLPTGADCGPLDPDTAKSALDRTWRFGNRNPIDFEDGQIRGSAAPVFDCIDDAADDTDILAIKRIESIPAREIVAAASDSRTGMDVRVFLKTNGNVAALFLQPASEAITSPTAAEFSPAPPYSYWAYVPSIYYIRNFSTAGEASPIPSLCRKRLQPNGNVPFESECIARGIEDMQLEFGVDTGTDSVADRFQETLPAALDSIVAVRVTLLARSEQAEATYDNLKTYQLTPTRAVTPGDNFYRRSLTTTVALRNPANLRKLK